MVRQQWQNLSSKTGSRPPSWPDSLPPASLTVSSFPVEVNTTATLLCELLHAAPDAIASGMDYDAVVATTRFISAVPSSRLEQLQTPADRPVSRYDTCVGRRQLYSNFATCESCSNTSLLRSPGKWASGTGGDSYRFSGGGAGRTGGFWPFSM